MKQDWANKLKQESEIFMQQNDSFSTNPCNKTILLTHRIHDYETDQNVVLTSSRTESNHTFSINRTKIIAKDSKTKLRRYWILKKNIQMIFTQHATKLNITTSQSNWKNREKYCSHTIEEQMEWNMLKENIQVDDFHSTYDHISINGHK